ncbi:MAG: signal peptidase II [Gemmatimonadaceae bacterium]
MTEPPLDVVPAESDDGHKRSTFWALIVTVLVLDFITKRVAEARLAPVRLPHSVFGDWFQWTLVYNSGAAFGLNLGPHSRWIFMALTIVALVILARLYRAALPSDRVRIVALGLVCGGAVGNLLDRMRPASRGVVDFIDIGVSQSWRWPTFNVADIAVSCGAILLAWALWGEDAEQRERDERDRLTSATIGAEPPAASAPAPASGEFPTAADG